MKPLPLLWLILAAGPALRAEPAALVFQTDFGQKDGAASAMRGVAFGVDRHLPIFDLTHEITPYNIWEAAYRLKQTAPYWPAGTVFVSVVDPGVGTERKSVVLQTKSGHYFVSPDNGTLTLVAEDLGIAAVREIDEQVNRLPGSEKSHTFHGRDVYAYTGARLAAVAIDFAHVGPGLPPAVLSLPHERARREGAALIGHIDILDINYGNVWTNIGDDLLGSLSLRFGDRVQVTITHGGATVFTGAMPYQASFGEVPEGEPLLYLNSLLNVAFALNMGNFATAHGIAAGGDWTVRIEKDAQP